MRRYIIGALVGILFSAPAWYFVFTQAPRGGDIKSPPASSDEKTYAPETPSLYDEILLAKTSGDLIALLKDIDTKDDALPPLPADVFTKITVLVQEVAFTPDDQWELIHPLATLAVRSGSIDLLRMLVNVCDGNYCRGVVSVEGFLDRHPVIFFSQADAWELWNEAGGAQECCEKPGATIPIIKAYRYCASGQKIFDDVKQCVESKPDRVDGDEWQKQAVAALGALVDSNKPDVLKILATVHVTYYDDGAGNTDLMEHQEVNDLLAAYGVDIIPILIENLTNDMPSKATITSDDKAVISVGYVCFDMLCSIIKCTRDWYYTDFCDDGIWADVRTECDIPRTIGRDNIAVAKTAQEYWRKLYSAGKLRLVKNYFTH